MELILMFRVILNETEREESGRGKKCSMCVCVCVPFAVSSEINE